MTEEPDHGEQSPDSVLDIYRAHGNSEAILMDVTSRLLLSVGSLKTPAILIIFPEILMS